MRHYACIKRMRNLFMFFEKNRRLLIRKNGAVESAAFCIKNKELYLFIFYLHFKKRDVFLKIY